ncbi:ABC transporter [Frondihabitans sp. PAMC 28766]|uniref:AAA family ATPase n=1 Tax=Frondihabitans sp. PAMC 28766 TaxID=1795630 RepID=UPI00078CD8AC|nr:AAA family ATPase [Frondihabitans sp. PAMC 28766]AMM20459.1 ABC transporter [Frondihabitans sp. PAMC 28766]
MIIDRLSVPEALVDRSEWPFTVPAVRALVDGGLTLTAPVTFFVGENGTGKSTVVEALAEKWGLDVRSGKGGHKYASELSKSTLGEALRINRVATGMVGRKQKGFFLRAETATVEFERHFDFGDEFTEASHGESFRAAFDQFFGEKGLYVLDEPESALSFTACLKLLSTFSRVQTTGSQVVCATHSPLLTALPGADIVEFGDHGLRRVAWADLEIVQHWRRFLTGPEAYLRYL